MKTSLCTTSSDFSSAEPAAFNDPLHMPGFQLGSEPHIGFHLLRFDHCLLPVYRVPTSCSTRTGRCVIIIETGRVIQSATRAGPGQILDRLAAVENSDIKNVHQQFRKEGTASGEIGNEVGITAAFRAGNPPLGWASFRWAIGGHFDSISAIIPARFSRPTGTVAV